MGNLLLLCPHVFKAVLLVSVLIYVSSSGLLAAENELKFDLHTFAVNFLPVKAFVSAPIITLYINTIEGCWNLSKAALSPTAPLDPFYL